GVRPPSTSVGPPRRPTQAGLMEVPAEGSGVLDPEADAAVPELGLPRLVLVDPVEAALDRAVDAEQPALAHPALDPDPRRDRELERAEGVLRVLALIAGLHQVVRPETRDERHLDGLLAKQSATKHDPERGVVEVHGPAQQLAGALELDRDVGPLPD